MKKRYNYTLTFGSGEDAVEMVEENCISFTKAAEVFEKASFDMTKLTKVARVEVKKKKPDNLIIINDVEIQVNLRVNAKSSTNVCVIVKAYIRKKYKDVFEKVWARSNEIEGFNGLTRKVYNYNFLTVNFNTLDEEIFKVIVKDIKKTFEHDKDVPARKLKYKDRFVEYSVCSVNLINKKLY